MNCRYGVIPRLVCVMLVTLLLLVRLSSSEAFAASAGGPGAGGESVAVALHDLELIDQDGRGVRFGTDVIGGRIAVVIPFYTTCPTSYPILIFTFKRVREMLGDRLGKDVVLVSVTVDPKTDTPARLKAYADRQRARSGWVFLTGERDRLGAVLQGLGLLSSTNIDEHNHIPVTVVGSVGGEWRRLHGFPSPDGLMALIGEMLESRGN